LLDDVFPFLPADFQDDYFQSAPADQQVGYPAGGEEVFLLNLTPQGRTAFRLAQVEVPVVFFPKRGARTETQGVIDTVVIEPDKGRFTLTWRASIPLRRGILEIAQVLAGHQLRGWWRARASGKTYYPNLGHALRDRQEALQGEEGEET
jgi:hypothetical protein